MAMALVQVEGHILETVRSVLPPYGFNFVPRVFPNILIQLAFVFGTANVVHPVSLYLSHRFSFRTLGNDYHDRRGTAHTLLYMCCMALHHPSTSHCHRQMAKRSQTPILATLGARISEWGARVISNLCSDPTCCSWDQ
jgi:hypothetical protein